MKRIFRTVFSWKGQFVLILLTLIMGYTGYYVYFTFVDTNRVFTNPFVQTLYSTIRLFAAAFDANRVETLDFQWVYIILEIARWLALMVTVPTLLKLLKPLFARAQSDWMYQNWKSKKNKILLLGDNDENGYIYSTLPIKTDAIVLNDSGCKMAFEPEKWNGYRRSQEDAVSVALSALNDVLKHSERTVTLIVNTMDEKRNLEICSAITRTINSYISPELEKYKKTEKNSSDIPGIEKHVIEILNRIHVVVFSEQRYEDIYMQLQRDSIGTLRYVNRYLMSAFTFALKHPLTEIMPLNWIHKGCVDHDVEMNVIFIGFGETNKNIYSVHRTVNQFATMNPQSSYKIPQHKPVHYTIFDLHQVSDIGLNHSDLRYEKDFLEETSTGMILEQDYLPYPDQPAITDRIFMDYNNPDFYHEIKQILRNDNKSVNQIIICVGDDLENADLAQKLMAKKQEWGIDNLEVYAKIRDKRMENVGVSYKYGSFVPFGNEGEELLSFEKIIHNPVIEMARKRNLLYEIESCPKKGPFQTVRDKDNHATFLWYTMDPNKQMSNIYAMLSIRMKLNLMGMDFTDDLKESSIHGRQILSNDDFMAIYAKDDILPKSNEKYMGMDIRIYPGTDQREDFMKNILRKTMTIQEHFRWNAYMMSCGFVPASKEQIRHGQIRDYDLRIHANLTTFEGLFEYRELLAKWHHTEEYTEDVIRYDYQIMDGIWGFLHENGFIVYQKYMTNEN